MLLKKETKRTANRLANERGLTILELMAVLIILGLILGIVYQAVFPRVEKAKIDTARAQMAILETSLDNYRLDVGTYPNSLQELVESSQEGWRGPYLKKKNIPLDPWKNPYVYEVTDNGNNYRLSSTGGGEEPINSWE